MERRPPRRARGGARPAPGPLPAPRRPAEPPGTQLWLFPSAAGLRRALPPRAEATRQMCCTRGRLVVLERGGAGVEVHQLPAGSDVRKPSEWGGRCRLGAPARGCGCEGGRPGPGAAPGETPGGGWRCFSRRTGRLRARLDAAGRVAFCASRVWAAEFSVPRAPGPRRGRGRGAPQVAGADGARRSGSRGPSAWRAWRAWRAWSRGVCACFSVTRP
ncbi:E3 ISG15--protein ligase HERC5 [Vulpes lagopus]